MFLSDVMFLVRVAVAFTAIVVLPLSFWGFVCFARRGGQTVVNALRSVAFLTAASAGSFQWTWLVGDQAVVAPSPRVLFSTTLILATLVVSALLLLRLRGREAMAMARVEENILEALAITDLARVCPEEAEMFAAECRRRTAEIMVDRGRCGRHG